MGRKSTELKLIGYGLSIVYGVGLFIYLVMYLVSFFDPQRVVSSSVYFGNYQNITDFQNHAIVFWILYFPQFIAFFAIARLQEWGRKLVVGLSILMCLYFGYQMLTPPVEFLEATSFFIYLLVALFFSQMNIRFQFRKDIKQKDKTVLVIDDDRTLIKTVRYALLSNGFDCLIAATGEQGLQVAKKNRPDLILLDVILPRMKGREVCLKLKTDKRTKEIPVIFLTAKDSPDDVRAEMEAGGASHLTKPVDSQKLISEIVKVLG